MSEKNENCNDLVQCDGPCMKMSHPDDLFYRKEKKFCGLCIREALPQRGPVSPPLIPIPEIIQKFKLVGGADFVSLYQRYSEYDVSKPECEWQIYDRKLEGFLNSTTWEELLVKYKFAKCPTSGVKELEEVVV